MAKTKFEPIVIDEPLDTLTPEEYLRDLKAGIKGIGGILGVSGLKLPTIPTKKRNRRLARERAMRLKQQKFIAEQDRLSRLPFRDPEDIHSTLAGPVRQVPPPGVVGQVQDEPPQGPPQIAPVPPRSLAPPPGGPTWAMQPLGTPEAGGRPARSFDVPGPGGPFGAPWWELAGGYASAEEAISAGEAPPSEHYGSEINLQETVDAIIERAFSTGMTDADKRFIEQLQQNPDGAAFIQSRLDIRAQGRSADMRQGERDEETRRLAGQEREREAAQATAAGAAETAKYYDDQDAYMRDLERRAQGARTGVDPGGPSASPLPPEEARTQEMSDLLGPDVSWQDTGAAPPDRPTASVLWPQEADPSVPLEPWQEPPTSSEQERNLRIGTKMALGIPLNDDDRLFWDSLDKDEQEGNLKAVKAHATFPAMKARYEGSLRNQGMGIAERSARGAAGGRAAFTEEDNAFIDQLKETNPKLYAELKQRRDFLAKQYTAERDRQAALQAKWDKENEEKWGATRGRRPIGQARSGLSGDQLGRAVLKERVRRANPWMPQMGTQAEQGIAYQRPPAADTRTDFAKAEDARFEREGFKTPTASARRKKAQARIAELRGIEEGFITEWEQEELDQLEAKWGSKEDRADILAAREARGETGVAGRRIAQQNRNLARAQARTQILEQLALQRAARRS